MNKKNIFIDEFGYIVLKEQSKYQVTLSGSFNWSYLLGAYLYEIKTIIPKIPLNRIISKELLF